MTGVRLLVDDLPLGDDLICLPLAQTHCVVKRAQKHHRLIQVTQSRDRRQLSDVEVVETVP